MIFILLILMKVKMNFEEEVKRLEQKLKDNILPLKEKIRKYEEDFEKEIATIVKIKNLGLESYDEYIYWNSLDNLSQEYYEIEQKRANRISLMQKNNLEKYKNEYVRSILSIKILDTDIITPDWNKLIDIFDSKEMDYVEMEKFILDIIDRGRKSHYQNLFDEIIRKKMYLVCPCGAAFYPENDTFGYCEKSNKHFIYPVKNIPTDILDWTIEIFLEEQPLEID